MIVPHLLLAEVAPAGPALPGVAFGVATLATLLAFIACWGLRHAWAATIGYGLRWIAAEIRGVSIPTGFFGSIHPFDRVADVFEAVDHFVAHALAVAALNTQHAFVYCAHTTAHIFVWTGEEIARLARDTLQFGESLFSHTLPRLRRLILHYVRHLLRVAVSELHHFIRALERRLLHGIRAAEARALHAVHVVAGEIAHVLPRIHGLERDIRGIRARIKQLEHLLRPAAFAALVAAAIGTIAELRFIRCRQFRRLTNERGCGLWGDLGALLGIAFIGLEIASLDELIGVAQTVTEDVVKGVEDLLKV